jgi:hypothetical protein
VADSCEHGNEPSDAIKVEEFCDQLNYSQRLKKDSAVWDWAFSNFWMNAPNFTASFITIMMIYLDHVDYNQKLAVFFFSFSLPELGSGEVSFCCNFCVDH